MLWLWILLAVLLLGGLAGMFVYTWPISKRVYNDLLVRTSEDKWGRCCSAPDNEEQVAMWDEGCRWGEANRERCTEVHIRNDGLNLYGEFYRFDRKKCVIILPGRCECLKYSYFFARPYAELGYSVLVADQRAHGKSEGKYNTVGERESDDLKAWAAYLRAEWGVEQIVLHCLCVGSAGALIALTDEVKPLQADALITEGCYVSFRESFKRHMIANKRPLFPVLDMVMHHLKRHTGMDYRRTAPIRLVKRLDTPVLFLFGRQDVFSVPARSQQLFDSCRSAKKRLVWFDKGPHSHLRINNEQAYDQAIQAFLRDLDTDPEGTK